MIPGTRWSGCAFRYRALRNRTNQTGRAAGGESADWSAPAGKSWKLPDRRSYAPMARRADSAADVEGGSWRPDAAQLGWIIENRLDEAYVLSWPGQLETYVPLHDTGGYDRARAPLGSYDFRLDQVKGTASLHPGNLLEMSFATPALHPRRHLDFTFLDFDLQPRDLTD